MGSHLCPGSAKQIIQELEQLEKGQKSYEVLFKGCLNIRQNKLNQILYQQEQNNNLSHYSNAQPSQHPSAVNTRQVSSQIEPVELKENTTVQIEFQDGTKYKGEVKDGLPHGQGEEITYNGHYKGNFNMGFKEGYGVYNYANKQRYQGSFQQNMIWGKGVYIFANGDRYEGQFTKNERSGKGKYIFSKNNKEQNVHFEGNYKNDLKQGKGRLKNANYQMVGIWKCGLYEFSLDEEFLK